MEGKEIPKLAKIVAVKPFGLIVKIEGENEGFIFEKDVSDFFIPDLGCKFKIGESIFVVKKKCVCSMDACPCKRRPSYSYKICHQSELKHDPLFSKIQLEVKEVIAEISQKAEESKKDYIKNS